MDSHLRCLRCSVMDSTSNIFCVTSMWFFFEMILFSVCFLSPQVGVVLAVCCNL